MAVKPRMEHVVVGCPPSSAAYYGRVEAGNGARGGCGISRIPRRIWFIFGAAAAITGVVLLCVFFVHRIPDKDPVYSVSVAGVDGTLSSPRPNTTSTSTLSPVLNLTVRVDNAQNALGEACVRSRSTATVSYGDAFLGRGSVPGFCAEPMRVEERAARVWGQDVPVPGFLRDQLAAELKAGVATVDVQVTMPEECMDGYVCVDSLLVCRATIGGGFSTPCDLTRVRRGGDDDD